MFHLQFLMTAWLTAALSVIMQVLLQTSRSLTSLYMDWVKFRMINYIIWLCNVLKMKNMPKKCSLKLCIFFFFCNLIHGKIMVWPLDINRPCFYCFIKTVNLSDYLSHCFKVAFRAPFQCLEELSPLFAKQTRCQTFLASQRLSHSTRLDYFHVLFITRQAKFAIIILITKSIKLLSDCLHGQFPLLVSSCCICNRNIHGTKHSVPKLLIWRSWHH